MDCVEAIRKVTPSRAASKPWAKRVRKLQALNTKLQRNPKHQTPNPKKIPKLEFRESGVVFGSEIMKKANTSSAPFWRRCSGRAIGSPSQNERPKIRASQPARKARVTSARDARWTTSPPRQRTRKAKKAKSPHWPG